MIERLNRKQFLSIRDDWDAMSAGSDLFATHTWMRIWLAHFGDKHHVVLTYRENGKLLAGALFHVRLGVYDQNLEQYPWPWVVSSPSLANPYKPFLEHLRKKRGVRQISLIQEPSEATELIASSEGYHCLSAFARIQRGIDVSTTFAAYDKSLKKKVRAELHRRDKHMREDIPSAELVRHDDPIEEFEIIQAVERDSWKESEHTAIISSQRDSAFYSELLSIDDPKMSPRLYSLDTDDGPIAYVIGILYEGCLYALKTSFTEAHAKLSPGSVLFYRAIKEICEDEPDVETLELLGNDAQWKRHLSTYKRELFDHRLMRDTLQNRAYVFAWTRVRPAVKNHRVLGPIYQRVRKRIASD